MQPVMQPVGARAIFVLAAAGLVGLAGCNASGDPTVTPPPSETVTTSPEADASTPAASSAASPVALASDPLHGIELVDVRTGTTFALGELAADRPVLLETMAIWCTNCRIQQHEVVAAHDLATFHSVSLDIDPNERPDDLAAYAADQGFGWRFAMANQELASALRERFGSAVLNPPSTPMILLFPDGSVRALEFRSHDAAELAAEIAAG
jgi:hypothetical protein